MSAIIKKQVTILASEQCLFSGVIGPMDMFLQAGVIWNWFNNESISPYFDVRIVTLDGLPVTANNQMLIQPHCGIHDIQDTDLVILPSQGAHFHVIDDELQQKVEWLRHWYKKGAHLASICTGAFTLAETGLLSHKQATTHWAVTNDFRTRFPDIILRTDLMITDEENIFCGGGISADLSLALYLIDKYCGRDIALQCSRCSLVDLDRISQLPFSVFMPHKSHDDTVIMAIQDWIDANFKQNIHVDDLAHRANLSTRQFNRRFKDACGESVTKYIQLVRIEAAKTALSKSDTAFDEISLQVGYENVSFFRKVFKQATSLSPGEYRKKTKGS